MAMLAGDHTYRRLRISINGAVQGVGFRPYVFSLATRLGLGGYILNEPSGVEIEIEGTPNAVEAFLSHLQQSPPPLARIQSVQTRQIPPQGEKSFSIRPSSSYGSRTTLVAPDQGTCDECLREINDPQDRRYRYSFTNCTNCGPRYTIIRDVPYDRVNTTMAAFVMCPECREEYEDPSNRRFHAEPTCCPICGPRLALIDSKGELIPCEDPIQETILRLERGEIVAVKGLGGFHLACDAANANAVRTLRQRKIRDMKPFALLVRDTESTRKIAHVSAEEETSLSGRERPIVLLKKRLGHGIAEEVAPRSAGFGIMLPYTPIHYLLMQGALSALVFTSGNKSDEPISFSNDDALTRLSNLADCFLLHDRDIHIRTDDSVVRVALGRPRFLRRSRGYAPFPVSLPVDTTGHEILATGPELSATLCVTRGSHAFLSHHLGDLEHLAAYESFLQSTGHLSNLLAVKPLHVACDLHPGYASTRYAKSTGLPCITVQHHHAHIASVLIEAGRTDPVIGVSFDGLGWGDDGALWGGEFLVCDLAGYERLAHLRYVPQPGGDACAKRPLRMAYVHLRQAFETDAKMYVGRVLKDLDPEEQVLIDRLIQRNVNCPKTSSMGRLFDAASAILEICSRNTYHAQAPMELEACASETAGEQGFYEARTKDESGSIEIDAASIIRGVTEDKLDGIPVPVCAARFHNSIARMISKTCCRIRGLRGVNTVALSGGVFANAFLVERAVPLLEDEGFEVLLNSLVPAGDGGISLGQAGVAAWRLSCA